MNYRIPKSGFEEFKPEVYMCKRATRPFVLDGNIDKDFWADAPYTNEFVDIEGDIRPKPRFATRAKMLWDDDNLYIAAELMGNEIWATVTERDEVIFYDNDFEVFIDPDSDTQQYYEFEMNALNTVWDLLLTKAYRDGGRAVNSFDIKGLRTAVKIDGWLNDPLADNKKWSCEIVMPFETLKECNGNKSPQEGDFWRINFSRVQWKVDVVDGKYIKRTDPVSKKVLPEDNWVWSPTGIVNMHYPELWGFVFFTEGSEQYKIPADEYKKWELRKLYYAQHAYFDENGSFTTDISKLTDKTPVISPKIQITDNWFEMSCKAEDGKRDIIIFADGAIVIK